MCSIVGEHCACRRCALPKNDFPPDAVALPGWVEFIIPASDLLSQRLKRYGSDMPRQFLLRWQRTGELWEGSPKVFCCQTVKHALANYAQRVEMNELAICLSPK